MVQLNGLTSTAADKVSCSRTQHSESAGNESRTSNPLIPSVLDLQARSVCFGQSALHDQFVTTSSSAGAEHHHTR